MKQPDHDILTALVKRNPAIVSFLLASCGHRVPTKSTELVDSQFVIDRFRELRDKAAGPMGKPRQVSARRQNGILRLADVVVACEGEGDRNVVVCEVQTSKPTLRQRRRQLTYLVCAGDLNKCRALLLVLTVDRIVARACAQPFRPGHPHLELNVVVAGPHNTPRPDAPGAEEVAAELAVMGVMNRNLDFTNQEDKRAALTAISHLTDEEDRRDYGEYLWNVLPAEVRDEQEDDVDGLIEVPILARARSQGRAEGKAEGMAEGMAEMVLALLQDRGIAVPEDVESQVRSCADHDKLVMMVRSAATASTLADVFPVSNGPAKLRRNHRENAA